MTQEVKIVENSCANDVLKSGMVPLCCRGTVLPAPTAACVGPILHIVGAANMMTTNDAAKAIRKQLRTELGATSRQVSVRSDKYSMGSTIHVIVKDASISLADVERIARGQQSVSYCEASGEILSGGNRFVNVGYSAEATEPTETMVRSALTGLDAGRGVHFGEMEVWQCTRESDTWRGWDASGKSVQFYGLHSAVRGVAVAMLSGEAG